MEAPALRPMSMADILDGAFQVYRSHFVPMFVVAVVTFFPAGLLFMMAGEPVARAGDAGVGPVVWLVLILALPVTTLGWAGLTDLAHRGVVGRAPGAGTALRRGLRATLRLLGFGVLAYVALFLTTLAVALPVGLGAGAGAVGLDGGSLVLVGLLILAVLAALVVGAVALTWWGAVVTLGVPVLVVEGVGALKAFGRAHELSRGARLRIVTVGFVAWLAVMLPTLGLLLVFGLGTTLWNPAATTTAAELYLENALLSLSGVLTTPFVVAAMVLIYLDRRVRREGYDVELASASLASGESGG